MQSSHNYGAQSSYIGSIQALSAYYYEEGLPAGSTHISIRKLLHTSLVRAVSYVYPFAVEEDSAVDGERSLKVLKNSHYHQNSLYKG